MISVFAPAERRWWREENGNAVLTRLPGRLWRRIPLPRQFGQGYRNVLSVALDWDGRTVSVMAGQIDSADAQAQFAAAKAVFDSLPLPAIMILDWQGRAPGSGSRRCARIPGPWLS